LIALGYGVRASGVMPRPFWSGVNALNHRILLPAFLFTLLARSELTGTSAGALALVSVLAALVLAGLAFAAGRLLGLTRGESAALISVAVIWNLVLTLALAERLLGPEINPAGAILVAPGILTGAAIAVIAFSNAKSGSLTGAMKSVAIDPVILSLIAGVIASLTGFAGWAGAVMTPLEMLGAGAMAIIVLSIGAGLDFSALNGRIGALLLGAGLRTLAGPIVFGALAILLGLEGELLVLTVIAGAAPGAAFAYAIADSFETETGLMAGMLTASVLVSALALPAFTALAIAATDLSV
jgi:malonate transporter